MRKRVGRERKMERWKRKKKRKETGGAGERQQEERDEKHNTRGGTEGKTSVDHEFT